MGVCGGLRFMTGLRNRAKDENLLGNLEVSIWLEMIKIIGSAVLKTVG